MSEGPRRVVWTAAGVYALVLSFVTVLSVTAFVATHDLGIFAQYVWLLGHGHEPFGTIALRSMLVDHFQPTVALLAPLGSAGLQSSGLLVLQAVSLALVAPLLYEIARRSGASRALAAVPALLWLASPVVVRANLFDFHPDVLLPALLVGAVLALFSDRTPLFIALLVLAAGLKEDVGFTIAMLGVALVLEGRRRLGARVAVVGFVWSLVVMFVALPLADSDVREHYTRLFVGDRGDGMTGFVAHAVKHPVDLVGSALAPDHLGILVMLLATTGGLCLFAPRWLLVALPVTAVNLISAYEPQGTLAYHYWIVPAAGVALAGAVGAGRLPSGWEPRTLRGAAIVGVLLATLTVGALHERVSAIHAAWPLRSDRQAAVREIPGDAGVAVPQHYFAPLSGRVGLYAIARPGDAEVPGSSLLTIDELAARSDLRYVIVDEAREERPSEVDLDRLGFIELARYGGVTVFRR